MKKTKYDEKKVGKLSRLLYWMVPSISSKKYDKENILNYLKKRNPQTMEFSNDPGFEEYFDDKIKKYRLSLTLSKLAELDKFGIFIGGEEIGEIPFKAAVYTAQLFDIIKNREIDKKAKVSKNILYTLRYLFSPENLHTASSYIAREGVSLVPVVGDSADVSNRYLTFLYDHISRGMNRADFLDYQKRESEKYLEKEITELPRLSENNLENKVI